MNTSQILARPVRQRRKWTEYEERMLEYYVLAGYSPEQISELLTEPKRTKGELRQHVYKRYRAISNIRNKLAHEQVPLDENKLRAFIDKATRLPRTLFGKMYVEEDTDASLNNDKNSFFLDKLNKILVKSNYSFLYVAEAMAYDYDCTYSQLAEMAEQQMNLQLNKQQELHFIVFEKLNE